MSVLASHLRGLIFSNLRDNLDPRIRTAMWELFNAVDSDLDTTGYSLLAEPPTVSSTTEEAVEKLDRVLSGFDKLSIDTPEDDRPAPSIIGEIPGKIAEDEVEVYINKEKVYEGPLHHLNDEDDPNEGN